ncbi:prephenate dehydratase [Candidatus Methylospira mobilis]|uniref:Bifunctional chorismate mutase/prephenate dehydratase n=1 Tax=Candidatus Methylospira mobilis TaxID=1808979 RepID=A0A5Q0BKC5_9GAMM|nr:prephenate dehydratase [Candidatus Methylospira mobilis]QFY42577.1 prephenate dehydratase [Candidatus Methylospira mobilis]WNV04309.1 prephenate dehydratase [Candidatus Methylospira mobilis]
MTVEQSLSDLRRQIDDIDDQILALINRRARCAQAVGEVKARETDVASGGSSFYRPEREAEVLRRVAQNNPGPLGNAAVIRFFRELMSEGLALEQPLTVAFLGPEGTFSQQAAFKHFGRAIQDRSAESIGDVFRQIDRKVCQFGVVPVENSTEGVITQTLDCFLHFPLLIVGEVILRIHHNLMGVRADLSGENAHAIRCIYSHQQSLAQCRGWLDKNLPHAERISVSSNAEAARRAVDEPDALAIAGDTAAEIYGLHILHSRIEDEPGNTTRFWVIGHNPVGSTGCDKTSLLVSTQNTPGALYNTLEPFARFKISMSKIESRPSRRENWDYVFFIDVEGHQSDPALASALQALQGCVNSLNVLGSYPRATV